jgi:hypothetical protein
VVSALAAVSTCRIQLWRIDGCEETGTILTSCPYTDKRSRKNAVRGILFWTRSNLLSSLQPRTSFKTMPFPLILERLAHFRTIFLAWSFACY